MHTFNPSAQVQNSEGHNIPTRKQLLFGLASFSLNEILFFFYSLGNLGTLGLLGTRDLQGSDPYRVCIWFMRLFLRYKIPEKSPFLFVPNHGRDRFILIATGVSWQDVVLSPGLG